MKLITQQQIYNIYVLQSKNVRKLSQVKENLIRDINDNLRRNKCFEVEIKTKLLSLLYSAWSEAQFVQILHTPNGFFPRVIKKIEEKRKDNGIISGWNLMLELAIEKVGDVKKSGDLANRLIKLKSIVEEHIEKQSILRNKIAHGQWVHALNASHTQENEKYSLALRDLDYAQIDKLFEIHKYLGLIVRDLVQSPRKGFHNNYWEYLIKLENYLEKSKDWNIETRKLTLNKRKKARKDLTTTLTDDLEKVITSQAERLNKSPEEVVVKAIAIIESLVSI